MRREMRCDVDLLLTVPAFQIHPNIVVGLGDIIDIHARPKEPDSSS